MKRSAAVLGCAFLVYGCGGEKPFVINVRGIKADELVRAKVSTLVPDERKLERARAWREALRKESTDLVAKCITKLKTKPKPGVSEQSAALKRIQAAKELANLADKAATEFLMEQAVQDKKKKVKIECIKALGKLEDYTAVPLLIQFLEDRELKIADAALEALNDICRPVTYREFTFSGKELRQRKKTARRWWRWWTKGGKEQLAKHTEES